VLSTPNGARLSRALESLDFMVSVDIYVNETTRFADFILPTTTALERSNYDIVFQALMVRNGAKWSPRVLEPPPDARAPWEVLMEIAARVNQTKPEELDELVFSHLLAATVGRPDSACPGVTLEEARRRLGEERGPERILDLMLRAGPWGDRFVEDAEGLSLARLRSAPHGLDLGPLGQRLPTALATASGAIELAPEPIVSDVERLRSALKERGGDGLLLVGRRQVRSNNSWMHNIYSLAKGRDRCTLRVHPDDARCLGLREGAPARIR
jgi:anaerobic selenocysteine-containing dehydrogenase